MAASLAYSGKAFVIIMEITRLRSSWSAGRWIRFSIDERVDIPSIYDTGTGFVDMITSICIVTLSLSQLFRFFALAFLYFLLLYTYLWDYELSQDIPILAGRLSKTCPSIFINNNSTSDWGLLMFECLRLKAGMRQYQSNSVEKTWLVITCNPMHSHATSGQDELIFSLYFGVYPCTVSWYHSYYLKTSDKNGIIRIWEGAPFQYLISGAEMIKLGSREDLVRQSSGPWPLAHSNNAVLRCFSSYHKRVSDSDALTTNSIGHFFAIFRFV